ncbi:MAG TPA: MerR family DNA-binding transcriptional regulator [Candidatus Dormibacteraeota bacterium]|nr:MerR family DNA-binding transcriptional regulator [Candidatus Dormibacteraeota bacterium]
MTRRAPSDTSLSLDKPIYTISVASEILQTHPRTLMMYEHLGLVIPRRTSTNRRRFPSAIFVSCRRSRRSPAFTG